jgi:ribose 5-phosphate isomerase A
LVSREELKKVAVKGAMEWIETHYELGSNLNIGVGSGSTVAHSFEFIADHGGLTAVPTSEETSRELINRGVNVTKLEDFSGQLAFDIDGADEVDPELNLIKGGGGCHYREKKVARRSDRLLIVVDQTKLVDYLGQSFPLPVEVVPELKREVSENLRQYGVPELRKIDDEPVKTDNSNFIIDLELEKKLGDAEIEKLETELNRIEGVVENGFFVKRSADVVFVGTEDGVKILGES